MSLFRTGFFINAFLILSVLCGCVNTDNSVWQQINKHKRLVVNTNIVVCGLSNKDCIMCYSNLKSKLISLCKQYHVSKDSILFVTPELRKVEIEYLFNHYMQFKKEPDQKIESNELFEIIKKEIPAETGFNFFLVFNSEKIIVAKGIFHESE